MEKDIGNRKEDGFTSPQKLVFCNLWSLWRFLESAQKPPQKHLFALLLGASGTSARDHLGYARHGFIKVLGGEIRDEPIDISKVSDPKKMDEARGWYVLFCRWLVF